MFFFITYKSQNTLNDFGINFCFSVLPPFLREGWGGFSTNDQYNPGFLKK